MIRFLIRTILVLVVVAFAWSYVTGDQNQVTGEVKTTAESVIATVSDDPRFTELAEAVKQHAAWKEIKNSPVTQTVKDTIQTAYETARDRITHQEKQDGTCLEVSYEDNGETRYAGVIYGDGNYHTYKGEPESLCNDT